MRKFLQLTLLALFLVACDTPPTIEKITGRAQGTTYSVSYWSSQPVDNSALKIVVDEELARIDKVMSNYRKDSDIELFNQQKVANTLLPLNSEILELLAVSQDIHKKSLGCYDPTVGPLFSIWGFKKDNLRIPTAEQITQQLSAVGFDTNITRKESGVIKHHPETTIGLSAIGQGYAIAKISDILRAQGIENFLVEIGGEMLVAGTKPEEKQWKVGLERPTPNSQSISEIITLTGKQATAVMTSGTYRHYFDKDGKRYSHILDPRTGKPVEHDTVSATVLLPDASHADAWSTALLCLGSQQGLKVASQHGIPAIFYDMNGDVLTRTTNIDGEAHTELWDIKQVEEQQ